MLDNSTERYREIVGASVRRLPVTIGVYVAIAAVIGVLLLRLPTAFVPDEDKGAFFIDTQLPDGASLERTETTVQQVNDIIMSDPDVEHVVTVYGYSMLKGVSSSNSAFSIVILKSWDERPDPGATSNGGSTAYPGTADGDTGRARAGFRNACDPGCWQRVRS